jgi:integrase
LARGIYQDAYGISVVVTVHGDRREVRYPADTPLPRLKRLRDELRNRLKRLAPQTKRGTLAADVLRYLAQSQHLASASTLKSVLKAWTDLYGDWPRWRIGVGELYKARNKWLQLEVKPKTINNRVDALRALYHALDGMNAETPCDEIRPLPVERTPPTLINPALIVAVASELAAREATGVLRTAKTRARFMVCAACGVRPSELMRAKPEDIDVERRVWRIRTGKGGHPPGGFFLNDDLLAAWEVFIGAKAWGTFREGSWVRSLQAAGWPKGVRPYYLRASVGIELSEAGTDLADISAFLGHTRVQTTRSHYVPVLSGRMRNAAEKLAGRLDWPENVKAIRGSHKKPKE